MDQVQLNRAVAKATGDDVEVIRDRGFSLVDDDAPLRIGDLEALAVDWDQIQAEQATSLFRDRQARQAA